jgi:hypothetical protein
MIGSIAYADCTVCRVPANYFTWLAIEISLNHRVSPIKSIEANNTPKALPPRYNTRSLDLFMMKALQVDKGQTGLRQ